MLRFLTEAGTRSVMPATVTDRSEARQVVWASVMTASTAHGPRQSAAAAAALPRCWS